jgi:hypothetical protein
MSYRSNPKTPGPGVFTGNLSDVVRFAFLSGDGFAGSVNYTQSSPNSGVSAYPLEEGASPEFFMARDTFQPTAAATGPFRIFGGGGRLVTRKYSFTSDAAGPLLTRLLNLETNQDGIQGATKDLLPESDGQVGVERNIAGEAYMFVGRKVYYWSSVGPSGVDNKIVRSQIALP